MCSNNCWETKKSPYQIRLSVLSIRLVAPSLHPHHSSHWDGSNAKNDNDRSPLREKSTWEFFAHANVSLRICQSRFNAHQLHQNANFSSQNPLEIRPYSPQFAPFSAKIQKYLKISLMQGMGHHFGVTQTEPQFYNFADQMSSRFSS